MRAMAASAPYRAVPREREQRNRLQRDVWTDINADQPREGAPRLPDQKPEALLERIIQASSNEGDVVLDPFCGCGTAIAVAQRSTAMDRHRHHPPRDRADPAPADRHLRRSQVKIVLQGHRRAGIPARRRASSREAGPLPVPVVGSRTVGARPIEQKKGADKGHRRPALLPRRAEGGKTKLIIFSVKAGQVTVAHLRTCAA